MYYCSSSYALILLVLITILIIITTIVLVITVIILNILIALPGTFSGRAAKESRSDAYSWRRFVAPVVFPSSLLKPEL